MIKRIFKNTFWVSMVTLLIAYVIIVGILYDYFDRQIKTELKTEAEYIACGIESVGEEYLDSFDQNRYVSDKVDASQAHKNRITWVDSDGTVLFDSDADKEQMENHKDRAEIQSALKDGEGYTVRYSHTLDEQTIYYAVELPDGSVLRVSSAYNTVVAIIMAMMQPTLFLVLLIIVLSYLMSKSVAKRIVAPINNMDLMYGEMDEEYEELVPLLKRIRKQNILIDEQMDDLKTQQAKFQALTEHMREGFLVLDKKENVMSYNKAAVELLGASKDMDYTGHNVIQFDRERSLREAVDEAINGVRTQRTSENGDRIYRIVANPIVVQDVVKDETVEEEAPKADTVPKDQVEGAVVIILDETEKEKREQLRREFTSNVSHELKTPLTSISGVAEIIMNGIVKPEDIPGFAKNIYEEAGRLIDLVNDIIFLSKLDEDSSVGYQLEEISLLDMAKEVKARLKMPCQEKDVAIHIVGDDVVMDGVPSMVEEVVYNLCDNGIKYNKKGGRVAITLQQVTEQDISYAVIEVSDTGIGIAQDDQERVFERFYRVDKSHSKAIGGTGLGLSIVKHVVLFHHGH
ncbi:MAG: PAS domain-containing protein, partial [Clostridiales bacterium]|nr:PAS domain-containing protein [Clostridiales bacterium]